MNRKIICFIIIFIFFISLSNSSLLAKTFNKSNVKNLMITNSIEKRQALLVGMINCPATLNDINKFKDTLIDYNWDDNKITSLYGLISNTQVKYELNLMASLSTDETLSLFYYAGHGESDGYGESIITFGELLYDYEILEILDGFKGKIVVIFDSCYSGGMLESRRYSPKNSANWVILAACPKDSVTFSIRPYKNHGAFTYRLLEGLNGKADINNDKNITAEEIFDYAKNKSLLILPQILDVDQNKDITLVEYSGKAKLKNNEYAKNIFINKLYRKITKLYNSNLIKNLLNI